MSESIYIKQGGTLIVTGGNRGIGAAVVRLAAEKHHNIALLWNSDKQAASDVYQQTKKHGIQCKDYQLDITNTKQIQKCFGHIFKDFGSIDGLVNCAASHPGRKTLLDMSNSEIEKTINTVFSGNLHCIREAAYYMSATRNNGSGGVIVNLSSEAAIYGGNQLSVYASSKAAINTLTRGLARELADDGIRINAVSPGIIDTDQHAHLSNTETEALVSSIPLQRMGAAEEVAKAVLWLLSEESQYITGTVMSINGGR